MTRQYRKRYRSTPRDEVKKLALKDAVEAYELLRSQMRAADASGTPVDVNTKDRASAAKEILKLAGCTKPESKAEADVAARELDQAYSTEDLLAKLEDVEPADA